MFGRWSPSFCHHPLLLTLFSGSQGSGQLEWKANIMSEQVKAQRDRKERRELAPMAGMIQSTGQTVGGLALGTYEE